MTKYMPGDEAKKSVSHLNFREKLLTRIKRLTSLETLNINKKQTQFLNDFLYHEFEKQGRFKNPKGIFHLTSKFIIHSTASFLKISPSSLIDALKVLRPKRANTTSATSVETPTPQRIKNLIHILGRKQRRKYIITNDDGGRLTLRTKTRAQSHFSTELRSTPMSKKHEENGLLQATTPSGSMYNAFMSQQDGAILWKEASPNQRPRVSRASLDSNHTCNAYSFYNLHAQKNTTKSFQFTLTREMIIERMHAKRSISQKRLMGNMSAKEFVQEVGLAIQDAFGELEFHWAHRQGHSLAGDASSDNLDPMTAGANYTTLFKVEQPIKDLLLNKKVAKVCVDGAIAFDEDGLPKKVTYIISSEGKSPITVDIDPMDPRVPAVQELDSAKQFLDFTNA